MNGRFDEDFKNQTFDIYFKLGDALRRAGWRQDFSAETKKRWPEYSVLYKRFGVVNVECRLDTTLWMHLLTLAVPMPKGVPLDVFDEAIRKTTTQFSDFRTMTVNDIEREAKLLVEQRKSVAPPRKSFDATHLSFYDDDKGEYVTGDEALDAWKREAERNIRDMFSSERETWEPTRYYVGNLFDNYGHAPKWPMTREQGARIVRQILERLAKEGFIEKSSGGTEIEWKKNA